MTDNINKALSSNKRLTSYQRDWLKENPQLRQSFIDKAISEGKVLDHIEDLLAGRVRKPRTI